MQPSSRTDKRISFQVDHDDNKKIHKTSFYKYDKTAHQINKSAHSKLHQASTQSLTIDSSGLETLRNEILGTSRLPEISDLLSIRHKPGDNETLHKNLMSLIKYMQSLESILHYKNKEIKRLEYLNKFLVVANEKKEEMLTQTLKENQRLKELAVRAEKLNHNPEKRVPGSNIPPITYLSNPSPSYKKPSGLLHLKEAVTPTPSDRELRQIAESNLSPRNPLNTNRSNFQQTMNKLFDSRKSESILKINEIDANMLHNEDQSIRLLQKLVRDEDNFFQSVRNWEDHLLISVFDAITNVLKENEKLFEIVLKLKKILRAAGNMMQSLILVEAMEEIVQQVCECLKCDRATLWLVDEEKEELWSKVAKGSNETIRIPWNKGIVGSVIQKREPLNIVNAYADNRFNREVDMKTNYKTNTILCIPILDDRTGTNSKNIPAIGVIQAINKFDEVFDKDDEGLLSLLCNLAGVILKNSMYFGQEKMFHSNLRAILNTGIYLSSLTGIPSLLFQAEKKLQAIMNVEQAKIFIWNKEDDQLIRYTKDGGQERFPSNCGLAGYVLAQGEYENITNSYNHLLYNGKIDIETKMPIIVWPIKHPTERKEILGVFEVINIRGIQGMAHTAKSKLNVFDFEALEFFSKQLAQAIINNQVRQQSDHEVFIPQEKSKQPLQNNVSIINKQINPTHDFKASDQSLEIKHEKQSQEIENEKES